MRRHLWFLILFLSAAVPALAQSTTVSATITDAGGQAWFGGSYRIEFRPVPNNPGPYYWNGAAFTPQVYTGSLDSTGSFSGVSLPSNDYITPAGSQWTVTVCPAATTSTCYSKNLTITGSTMSLTSSLVPPAISIYADNPQPRFTAYNDSELYNANWGFQYYNLTDQSMHVCSQPAPGTGSSPQCTWVAYRSGTTVTSGSGSPPASSCTIIGSYYVQTGGTPTVYICSVVGGVNTWVAQSGTVTLVTSPPTSCTSGTWTYDTETNQLWLGGSGNTCTLVAGTGSGGSGLSGTANYLAKFTGTSNAGNSSVTDNSNIVQLTNESWSFNTSNAGTVTYSICSGYSLTLHTLVKYLPASNCVEPMTTSDVSGAIGTVHCLTETTTCDNGASPVSAEISQMGNDDCVFDGATTEGDYVIPSSTTGADCHDNGTALSTTAENLGHVNSTNAAGGTYFMNIFSPDVGGSASACKGKNGCGGGGGGTVTSVGATGNGVTVATVIPGSPVTTSGILSLPVPTAPAGYVPAGPIPAPGTNVAVRQWTACNSPQTNLSGQATFTCTLNNVVAGDQEVLWTYSEGGQWSPLAMTIADSLGSTWTAGALRPYFNFYETATVAASGNQTLTASVAGNVVGSKYTGVLYLIEITGVASLDAVGVSAGSPSNPATATVTTTAASDGILVLSAATDNGTIYPTMSPVTAWFNQSAWSFNSVVSADQEGIYGAGAAGSYSFTGTVPGGSGAQNSVIAIAYTESASASSAPLVLRKLTEADLPPTAVSAIQAVYSKNLVANVSLTAATLKTLDSDTITMPSQGGPFRVKVCYVYFTSPGTGTYGESYVTDGTDDFGFDSHEQVGALDGSPYTACETSPESYINNASVTFTVNAQNAGSQTVTTVSGTLSLPSHIQLVVFQSVN